MIDRLNWLILTLLKLRKILLVRFSGEKKHWTILIFISERCVGPFIIETSSKNGCFNLKSGLDASKAEQCTSKILMHFQEHATSQLHLRRLLLVKWYLFNRFNGEEDLLRQYSFGACIYALKTPVQISVNDNLRHTGRRFEKGWPKIFKKKTKLIIFRQWWSAEL